MKVLLFNGSPRENGCTFTALSEIASALNKRGKNFAHKPVAVIASARRAGTTATLDTVSKYLGIVQMPVISSTYWNMVHGNTPEETKQDLEGMQIMKNIALNMAWILRCIEVGRQSGITAPNAEKTVWTNFIR